MLRLASAAPDLTDIVRDAVSWSCWRRANADNVGGIFETPGIRRRRSACRPSCTDPLYRKAIRTSMGAALRVPFAAMAAGQRI